MLGTATRVSALAGMPSEKSMRGNGCGGTSTVASQLTRAMPSSLKAITPSTPIRHSQRQSKRSALASATSAQVNPAAIKPIGKR